MNFDFILRNVKEIHLLAFQNNLEYFASCVIDIPNPIQSRLDLMIAYVKEIH